MAEVLFPNFLKDKEEYLKSRAFWKEQFDKLANAHGFSYSSYLNDEPLEYDGNPIFNAWVPEIGRGVRIIQVEAEAEGPEMSAWLDTVEIQEGLVVEELVLDLVLSDRLQHLADQLITKWIVVAISKEKMNAELAQLPLP